MPSKLPRCDYAEKGTEQAGVFTSQHSLDFVCGPDEELAFFPLAVCVGRREEAAVFAGHFPEYVIQRFLSNSPVERTASGQPGVQVKAREKGVIVEHLLEVGHKQNASVEYRWKPPPAWS